MNDQIRRFVETAQGIAKTPAYPFSARELLHDLRAELQANQDTLLTYHRLARIIGRSVSTTHYWLAIFLHPQVLGFMTLLERLTPEQRRDYIETHCRDFPTLDHPHLNCDPGAVRKMRSLLEQEAGLSVVVGTDSLRTFLLTALGHTACSAGPQNSVVGIDFHRPRRFVPVETVVYVDESTGIAQMRNLTQRLWPTMITSSARMLLLNGVWSLVPEMQEEILRCASFKHVVIAEEAIPDLAGQKGQIPTPIHALTVSRSERLPRALQVKCRRLDWSRSQ